MTDTISLYGGALLGRKVGAFIMCGEAFTVIRPGFCAQGKRRSTWTQIVHGDVPIFDYKIKGDVGKAVASFESQFKRHIGDDRALLSQALKAVKTERRRKFMDGQSGEAPAPTLTQDGERPGHRYQK